MKAKVFSLDGKVVEEVDLPSHFSEDVRPDVIKKAVLAIQSHRRQPYGAYPLAGKEYAIHVSKRRRRYRTTYGYGQSRTPKIVTLRQGTRFVWKGAFAPQTVGGREAHPPKAEKIWEEKINKKENRFAIRSAIAATARLNWVLSRGHRVKEVPIVIVDDLESIKKAKEVEDLLKKLGLEEELERVKEKKIRAGKGTMRGRKYKKKVGPLFVVSKKCDLMKAAKNLPGVDVVQVKDLNAELLAPGTHPGRLVIWSKSAIDALREGMFQ